MTTKPAEKWNFNSKFDPKMALLLATGLALLASLSLLGSEVLERQPIFLDQPVMLWLHAHTTVLLLHLSEFLNFLGGPPVMFPVLLLIPLGLWFAHKRPDALFAATTLWGAAGTQWVLKRVFERVRPHLWPSMVIEHGPSFPSGHSAVAAALWLVASVLLWRTPYRLGAVIVGAVYTAVMAFSRVMLGVHYPTDVLAGILTAALMVLLAYMAVYLYVRPNLKGQG